MYRRPRLVILSVAILVFLAGAVSAYARCVEPQGPLAEQSNLRNRLDEGSHSHGQSVHCPEDLKAYAIGQAANLKKPESNPKQELVDAARSCLKSPHYTPVTLRSLFPSLSPYRVVPLYHLTLVYRI
jgi:hypothetical protein